MTIAEVAKQYGLTPDTLRYYEKVGLIPAVGRTPGGIRDYQQDDCRWIEFIKCMRGAGVGIEALSKYVSLFKEGDKTINDRKEILIHQKAELEKKLLEMQETLERLNKKIAKYDEILLPVERNLT